MVGHTGVIPAAVRAVETVDRCLGEVVDAVHASGGACIVTADHGNADNMLEPDGSPNTAHSLNPVPLIVTVPGLTLREGGILADVAPTVLALLGIAQPAADDRAVADRGVAADRVVGVRPGGPAPDPGRPDGRVAPCRSSARSDVRCCRAKLDSRPLRFHNVVTTRFRPSRRFEMALIRWEPVRELSTIQNEMNRLFNTFFDAPAPGQRHARRRAAGFRRWTSSRPTMTSCSAPICRG